MAIQLCPGYCELEVKLRAHRLFSLKAAFSFRRRRGARVKRDFPPPVWLFPTSLRNNNSSGGGGGGGGVVACLVWLGGQITGGFATEG